MAHKVVRGASSFMAYPFGLPLDPPAQVPGIQPRVRSVQESVGQEYVTEYGDQYLWPGQRVLDPNREDSRGLVPDPYLLERISRDSKVHKAMRILVGGVLTDDLQFAPGATEEEARDEGEYTLFTQVQNFSERIVGGLEEPIWRTFEQMFTVGGEQGHNIAETNWEERVDEPLLRAEGSRRKSTVTKSRGPGVASRAVSGLGRFFGFGATATPADDNAPRPPGPKRKTKILDRPKVRLMPKNIKPKPHGSALFVVDPYMNQLGIVPAWGRGNWTAMDVVSRDKFLAFTVNPRNGDPRGTSLYLPIIEWWALKQTVPFNYRKYLSQEALPIPIVKLPPNSQGWHFAKDPATGEVLTENGRPKFIEATESATRVIENMYNGKGVAVWADVEIDPYESNASKSRVFSEALETIDGQIEEGILMQPLAQSVTRGGGQSKSLGQVQEGRLTDQFFWYKRILATMLLYDLIAVAIRINLGQWAIQYLPLVSLGDSEKRDWANDLKVIAQAYFWGFIDDTMRTELCAWLGLPKPGPSRYELGQEIGANTDVNGNPVVNNQQRPDKQPGQKGRNDGNSTPKKAQAMSAEERQEWLDANWPDGTPRTFNSFEEAQTFIEGLRENVRTVSTRFSSLGHHARGGRGFVGYLPGRAKR